MKRRSAIAGLVCATAWPLAVHARSSLPTIGFLRFGSASTNSDRVAALRTGLRQLGYLEGKTIVIEYRWAETVGQLRAHAAELVALPVDVIVAPSSTEVEAARQATTTIPIVFASHADPIGVGHVASLSSPGGNITGLTMVMTDMVGKQPQLLKEVLPQAMRLAALANPTAPSQGPALQAVAAAGKALGMQIVVTRASTVEEFDGAFATMSREQVAGFVCLATPLTFTHRQRLADLALHYRLPGVFSLREHAEAGGFMSYGPDSNELMGRATVYVDKILKGSKPADLPVEQASKYDLVINLGTARAMGLTVPTTLLARTTEVIE